MRSRGTAAIYLSRTSRARSFASNPILASPLGETDITEHPSAWTAPLLAPARDRFKALSALHHVILKAMRKRRGADCVSVAPCCCDITSSRRVVAQLEEVQTVACTRIQLQVPSSHPVHPSPSQVPPGSMNWY